MKGVQNPISLKGTIQPEHLLKAIENSVAHSDESAHGVTGLHFKNYSIIVHKRKGLCWYIECRLKAGGERDPRSQATASSYFKMSKLTRKAIIASIVQNTTLGPSRAREALESVLDAIKGALRGGRQVNLGRLGGLSVVTRNPRNRASKNLKHVGPTIDRLYKKHPKTVRLLGGQDLSENPQPTIVHKKPQPAAKKSFAVAFPAWRGRIR
jgi:nucleoid DNA-binding protein